MSKQLAISAAFSVFAMAAFVLFATPDASQGLAVTHTGATAHAAAPALDRLAPAVAGLIG
ncbi:hypothetical protein OZN62_12330 [Aurantiacibacter sp. MUD11]|uniref:hypothetical protein n=1 Tax=Aurantiacibacter sp. MUD11 TaxID=3003265 RepID=UPI0022AA113B|nr:hypothetical protein [Aurantiacibacter sp. MUD11]WAT17688.1 hypothetical protein OZN62_12330 [Aurantiacibacter sp. MUD11]